jgi:hypothetical protein
MGTNILLDSSGDRVIANGQLQLVTGDAEVAQAVACELRTFLGEWFLDDSANPQHGFDYWGRMFVKAPNKQLILSLLRKHILGVAGVASVTSISIEIGAARNATIAWGGTTSTGGVLSNQTVTIP